MDSASILSLLGWVVVAAIVYGVSLLPPAAAAAVMLRYLAGALVVLGVVLFVLHVLQASGVVR